MEFLVAAVGETDNAALCNFDMKDNEDKII